MAINVWGSLSARSKKSHLTELIHLDAMMGIDDKPVGSITDVRTWTISALTV